MQYPQIQFYRGSLVRLANGQLKQVQELSSDDFIESARLAAAAAAAASARPGSAPRPGAPHPPAGSDIRTAPGRPTLGQSSMSLASGALGGQLHQLDRFNFNPLAADRFQRQQQRSGGSSGTLDENNNSVFNSPEPTSAGYDDSPRMETDGWHEEQHSDCHEDEGHGEDEEIDVELDVVTSDDHHDLKPAHSIGLNLSGRSSERHLLNRDHNHSNHNHLHHNHLLLGSEATINSSSPTLATLEREALLADQKSLRNCDPPAAGTSDADFYIDSSVVRDFLEVGPIHQQQMSAANSQQHQQQPPPPPSSTSPVSSTGSLTNSSHERAPLGTFSLPSTSSSSSGSLHQSSISPPIIMPQISTTTTATSETVLIKFFLETSRSIAFIEVPIEHPFFVFHRGWSSWSPQRTYDKFGLKCRKLKIGDTCISLIKSRRRLPGGNNSNRQLFESDQCNILFSSIKIHE